MNLFDPLGKEYCDYFYYLSVISFIIFALALLSILFTDQLKNENFMTIMLILLQPFTMYFQSRLFYSMCLR